MEPETFHHDRNLYPRKKHDCDGNVAFDISEAKKLLQQDVKDKKHHTMSCTALQCSRKEYKAYPAHKFKQRIYQA
eukprot:145414-Ditylum_brightwellii.AAC.1